MTRLHARLYYINLLVANLLITALVCSSCVSARPSLPCKVFSCSRTFSATSRKRFVCSSGVRCRPGSLTNALSSAASRSWSFSAIFTADADPWSTAATVVVAGSVFGLLDLAAPASVFGFLAVSEPEAAAAAAGSEAGVDAGAAADDTGAVVV